MICLCWERRNAEAKGPGPGREERDCEEWICLLSCLSCSFLFLRQAMRRWELLAFHGLMTQSSTNYDLKKKKKNFGMTTKSLSRDASLWCGWIKWEARCQEPQQTQKANGSRADFPEKNRQMSLKQGYYFHIKETITTLLFVTVCLVQDLYSTDNKNKMK